MKHLRHLAGFFILSASLFLLQTSIVSARTICVGQPATLNWSASNVTSCTPSYTGGCSFTPAAPVGGSTSGSQPMSPPSTCSAQLTCNGVSAADTLTVDTSQTWNGSACVANASPINGTCSPMGANGNYPTNSCTTGTLGSNAVQPDGTFQWYCNGVNGGATSPLCYYAPPTTGASCSYTGSLSWSPACTGYYSGTVPNGATVNVPNTAPNYSGSQNYQCSNGNWVWLNETCTTSGTCPNGATNYPTCTFPPGFVYPDLSVTGVSGASTVVKNTPAGFTSSIYNNNNSQQNGLSTGHSFYNIVQIGTGSGCASRFQDSTGDPFWTFLGYGPCSITDLSPTQMGTLAAGAAANSMPAYYTFSTAGTYYIRGCADMNSKTDTGTVYEGDPGSPAETNNCNEPRAITVIDPPTCPDGQYWNGTSCAVIPPPTNPVSSCSPDGLTGTFSWTAPAGFSTFYTRASTASGNLGAPAWDDNFVGTSKTFTTTPGESYSWWVHTKDPATGHWSVALNGGFVCPVSTLPNLTAGAISPTSAVAGSSATFASTISNIGQASTGASFTNFIQVASASNGGGTITDLSGVSMSTLGAGGTSPTSKAYTFPAAGTYSMRACADKSSSGNAGTITESNENNNCGPWTDIVVSAPVCPAGEYWNGTSCAVIPPPTNPVSSCSPDGLTGTFSWTAPAGFSTFYTRASTASGNLGAPAWDDNFVGTSKTFTTTPGESYSWWVHTKDPATGHWSSSIGGGFTCTGYPNAPINLSSSCNAAGTQAILSWSAAPNATEYYPRVQVAMGSSCPTGWTLYTDGTTCYINGSGTAVTFNTTPGVTYPWWVHSGNNGNVDWNKVSASSVMCPAPVPNPVISKFTVTPRTVESGGLAKAIWSIQNPNNQCSITAAVQRPATCNASCQSSRTSAENALNSNLSTGTTNASDPNGANRLMSTALRTPVSGTSARGEKSVSLDYTTTFTLGCGTSTTPLKMIIYVIDKVEG